jgi:hypothetical protein
MLFAICYFGLEEYDKSRSYFKLAVGENLQAQDKIDSIFDSRKAFHRPIPALAYTLSKSSRVGDKSISEMILKASIHISYRISAAPGCYCVL